MKVLGVSAFYHDSAACLVRDGTIVAAAQEERFTRKKHDDRFPAAAVAYCLAEGGITAAALLPLAGAGGWATGSGGAGGGRPIAVTHGLRFPPSLGLLSSAFPFFCGFRVNSGEYKLMGRAPYGQPGYAELILDRLMGLK